MRSAWLDNILFVSTVVTCLFIAEILLRASYLDDPYDSRNFAVDAIPNQVNFNMAILYDPVVGYIAKPGYSHGNPVEFEGQKLLQYNNNKWGMRKSPNEKRGLRGGLPEAGTGILITGDSFAYGSEVSDHETWAAYLEDMIGVPLMNFGVGGYGIDQSLLLMEQLIDEVKPKALMMSCIPNCIGRTTLSFHGGGLNKPYFLLDNKGNLLLQNNPVPAQLASVKGYGKDIGLFRRIFGHSYTIFWVFKQINKLDKWHVKVRPHIVEHDLGAEVSCALMKRYGRLAKSYGVPAYFIMEYSGGQATPPWVKKYHSNARNSSRTSWVLSCASESGVVVIDTFSKLREIYKQNENKDIRVFWDNWVRQAFDKKINNTGHMSAKGNKLVAEIVAKVIQERTPDLINTHNTSK